MAIGLAKPEKKITVRLTRNCRIEGVEAHDSIIGSVHDLDSAAANYLIGLGKAVAVPASTPSAPIVRDKAGCGRDGEAKAKAKAKVV